MEQSDKIEFMPEVLKYLSSTFGYNKFTKSNQDFSPTDITSDELNTYLEVSSKPPLFTTLRVNTMKETREKVIDLLKIDLKQMNEFEGAQYEVLPHPLLNDVIYIPSSGPHEKPPQVKKEVIVGVGCAMAVLRGANVYAQGVMAAPANLNRGDMVCVYGDVEGKCRKGLNKTFCGKKIYVGCGITMLSRSDLFNAEDSASGLAIKMNNPLYSAPSLNHVLPSLIFPQNLPSIVCGHLLNPQPGEVVLDMCAAPGGKTTHLAILMQNKGTVIALDKAKKKISRIESNAEQFGLSCICAYHYDSCKAINISAADTSIGPPYPPNSFDRILLDAPCSALGQRPSIYNKISLNEVKSFPVLQKALIHSAVNLLKPGGTLVYSTCTVCLEENEHQVASLLKKHPNMRLVKPMLGYTETFTTMGGHGLHGSDLTEEQRLNVLRFNPYTENHSKTVDSDTIGFFCAKFVKAEN